MDDFSGKLSIDTPENIVLDAEIAGFGTRCIAALIDYTILFVFFFIMTWLILRATPPQSRGDTRTIALVILLQFLVMTFYHLLFEWLWNGQTPGKRRTGIRVVQADGLPLTPVSTLIRNLVRLFDFLPLFYGIGLIVLFATRHTQRLGDLAARTVVIRERRDLKLYTLKEDFSVEYWHIARTEPIPHNVTLEHLTQEDRRTILDYLRRRNTLRERSNLALMVAQQIARKMDDPKLVTELSASAKRSEIFLEFVARAFELAERTED